MNTLLESLGVLLLALAGTGVIMYFAYVAVAIDNIEKKVSMIERIMVEIKGTYDEPETDEPERS